MIYTVLPPPRSRSPSSLQACVESVHRLVEELPFPLDALHVPEVRPEAARPDPRPIPFVPKLDPRRFAHLLQKELRGRSDTIVSRRVAYTHWGNQKRWLRRAWEAYQIRNLLLVGGESHKIRYPGPPVEEAARRIRRDPELRSCGFFLGGIAIPTRRGEPPRLLEKARSGIRFFTTQLLFEAESVQTLLRRYHELCSRKKERPRRIFLSFAPVSSERDLEFLRWMGVVIPPAVEAKILKGWIGTAWRSIAVAERILRDALALHREEKLGVPLGINVEHALKHNFEASRDLALALWETYRRHGQLWKEES